MELGRSNLAHTRAGSYEQELRPCSEMFSLTCGWEDNVPNSNFSKLQALSEMSRAIRSLYLGCSCCRL